MIELFGYKWQLLQESTVITVKQGVGVINTLYESQWIYAYMLYSL